MDAIQFYIDEDRFLIFDFQEMPEILAGATISSVKGGSLSVLPVTVPPLVISNAIVTNAIGAPANTGISVETTGGIGDTNYQAHVQAILSNGNTITGCMPIITKTCQSIT